MKTAIVVLNWNGWQDTLECLDSLLPVLERHDASLIVCDNASSDNSFAQILRWGQDHFPLSHCAYAGSRRLAPSKPARFSLLQTGGNLGFAGGNNAGIRHALSAGEFDYLWLLNNDTSVDPSALAALLESARQNPGIGMFGSTVVDYYRRDQVQCAGGCHYYPLITVYRNYLGGQPLRKVLTQPEASARLDYVYGASMFLRAAAVRRAGLLSEEYFLFYEELDYTQRLRQVGYDIAWSRASLVYHKGSATIGHPQSGQPEKLARANYYENLSTLKYTAKFIPKLLWPAMTFRLILKSLVLLLTGRWFLFKPLLRAYRDFLHLRGGFPFF